MGGMGGIQGGICKGPARIRPEMSRESTERSGREKEKVAETSRFSRERSFRGFGRPEHTRTINEVVV